MEKERREEILAKLRERFPEQVVDTTDWPKPYRGNQKIKAIVLGCDPTAFDRKDNPLRFEVVFGIGGPDKRYFNDIEKNLDCIGLHRDDIYVQNLCQNYFTEESSKNKVWRGAAQFWIKELKDELSIFPDSVPILLTSELLYKVLLNETIEAERAKQLYSNPKEILIPSEWNRLERPLIPLYRHPRYRLLTKQKRARYPKYQRRLTSLFQHQ